MKHLRENDSYILHCIFGILIQLVLYTVVYFLHLCISYYTKKNYTRSSYTLSRKK